MQTENYALASVRIHAYGKNTTKPPSLVVEGAGVRRAAVTGEMQQVVEGGTNELATGEEEAYQTVTGENHPAIDRNAPAAEEQIVPVEVPVGEEMDRLHPGG